MNIEIEKSSYTERKRKKKKTHEITIFLLKFKNLSCNQANGRQALKCAKKKNMEGMENEL